MSVSSSSESDSETESSSDKGCASPAPASANGDLEIRCSKDDAWYNGRVVLEGEKLTLKYIEFGDEEDEVWCPTDFRSLSELQKFEDRIRPLSVQLQDRECIRVTQGTVVCASFSVSDDIRFYDAVVEDVIHNKHSFATATDKEECLCTFVVVWIHGPRSFCFENRKIEHLCLVEPGRKVDPAVPLFLNMVIRRLDSDGCCLLNKADHCDGDVSTRKLLINQETENGKWHPARIFPCAERLITFSELTKEDVDFGGEYVRQLLLIDNMDKELCPSRISKFILTEASVSAEAYIFPSLSSETYTRGVISVDSKKGLEKLIEFLSSTSHMVVSYSGRPWVLKGTLSGSIAFAMRKCQCTSHDVSNAMDHVLKVVRIGTKEFNTAKQLKELFMEFAAHQQRLHSSLFLEEKKILEASNEV